MKAQPHSDDDLEGELGEQPEPSPIPPPEPVNSPKTHRKALLRDRWAVARKAYVDCGVSQGELATLLGVGESTVQGHVDRGGWTAARKEHAAEQRALAMKGVDQAALERQRKHEETLRRARERVLTNADVVSQTVMAAVADWIERRTLHEAVRANARAVGEDDPGPFRIPCPSKATDVNALTQALNGLLDYELKLAGEPGVRVRHEVVSVDVTELARAIIKG